jgi:hypothetical protein
MLADAAALVFAVWLPAWAADRDADGHPAVGDVLVGEGRDRVGGRQDVADTRLSARVTVAAVVPSYAVDPGHDDSQVSA